MVAPKNDMVAPKKADPFIGATIALVLTV